jgi:hypothetical protein
VAGAERRWGRLGRVDVLFVVVALACGATLLYLGRSLTFWEDEWRSIRFDGGPLDYLRPVNQHWSTFPLLLYRATLGVVGLRSYVPFVAEVIVLHLFAVGAAYALMRRRVGAPIALACAVPLLLLGAGAENLFWAFQTGFVGSVMFGLWAVFFLEWPGRRGPVLASVLLLAAVASSGMGLFFLVVAAGRGLFAPGLRLRVLAVLPPLAAYELWFALLGRDQVDDGRVFVDGSTVRFTLRGIVHATEAFSGLDHAPDGHVWGLIAFLGLSLLVALRVTRGRPPALAVGCLLAVVSMYVVIAFVRVGADPGYDHAISSRYVYVAAFLLVLAVADLLPEAGTWRVRERRLGVVLPAILLLVLAWSSISNVQALRAKRAEFQHASNVTRAFVELTLTRGNEPWVDRHAQRGWMPSVAELERTVERYGSPVEDSLFPSVVQTPDAADREEALLGLIGDAFRIEEPGSVADDVEVCGRRRVAPGIALWILDVPARARIRVTSSTEIAARIFLAHDRGTSRRLYASFEPDAPMDVVIPDVGDPRPWTLGVDSPASPASVNVCVLSADKASTNPRPRVAVRQWE